MKTKVFNHICGLHNLITLIQERHKIITNVKLLYIYIYICIYFNEVISVSKTVDIVDVKQIIYVDTSYCIYYIYYMYIIILCYIYILYIYIHICCLRRST